MKKEPKEEVCHGACTQRKRRLVKRAQPDIRKEG